MVVLYWRFHGDAVPDWTGYGAMYGGGGAWLLAQGRDPVFVWLLQRARDVFGNDGYGTFRLALFAVFTAAAAWIALIAPPQRRLGAFSVVAVVMMVLASFLLKGLAQIREGLAFVAVLAPAVAIFALQRRGVVRSGVGALLAVAVHVGSVTFAAVWLGAAAQTVLGRLVLKRTFQRMLLVAALTIALALAYVMLRDDGAVRFLLQDYGVDASAHAVGGLAKYAYWLGNGTLVLIVRHQLIHAAGPRRFAFLYASTLGSFVMPLLYILCLYCVFTDFDVPAMTSMIIRPLFSTMEFSLAVVIFRGRATWLTVAVMAEMIADRVRLLTA
jgi:hypothetical protein